MKTCFACSIIPPKVTVFRVDTYQILCLICANVNKTDFQSRTAPQRPNRIGNWLVLAVVATIMSACGEVFELAPAGESEGPPPDFIATTSPDNIQEFVNPESNQEGSGQVKPVTDNASQGQQETLPPQGGVEKEPSVAPATAA